MAYVMFQYDRPTDTRNWNSYNAHVRDWIAQLLAVPGAMSFMAYRTADDASPNTMTLLEFRSLDEARARDLLGADDGRRPGFEVDRGVPEDPPGRAISLHPGAPPGVSRPASRSTLPLPPGGLIPLRDIGRDVSQGIAPPDGRPQVFPARMRLA